MMDLIQELAINELVDTKPGQKLKQALGVFEFVQKNLLAFANSDDSAKLKLLQIGSTFQLFLIDTLASRGTREISDLTNEDWKDIADNVSRYAILESEKSYSEFVFDLYADYIKISADSLAAMVKAVPEKTLKKESLDAIYGVSTSIREKQKQLHSRKITEVRYIEECLWLSLEGMVKLLSAYTAMALPEDKGMLVQAVSQLGFEYARYVLYAKEQAILEEYIQNQYILDAQLQARYEAYLADLQANAERFESLIGKAFSPDIHEALVGSAELARSYGVKEEEILSSMEDIDSFFLD